MQVINSCCVLQEVGNRMTEQNLGVILGPNILHKEVKVRQVGRLAVLLRGGGL